MSILDGLLGSGGNNGTDTSVSSDHSAHNFATDPSLALNASDILHSFDTSSDNGSGGSHDASSFTGIGDIGLGVAAPTSFSSESTNEQYSQDHGGDHGGGLLGGLL